MPQEIVLSETQKETVYALLTRRKEIEDAHQKVNEAIGEHAALLANAFDVEGDTYKFAIDGETIRLVGETEEQMDDD